MEEKEYEDLVDLFATPGWRFFVKSTQDLKTALTEGAPDGALTNDQWQYARGQIHQLRAIGGYETYITALWKQQQEDALLSEIEDAIDVDSI